MLAISVLVIASIAAVYIGHHDLDKKMDLCKAFVAASFETAQLCAQSSCENPGQFVQNFEDADVFYQNLIELKASLAEVEGYQAAIEVCDQLK